MLVEEYKGFKIYLKNQSLIKLAEEIIDGNYKVEEEYKVTPRNYVAAINFKNEKYVLKIPRNEQRIFQRRIKTFFSKGESVTTFLNINKLIECGMKELYVPYIAGVKRKNGVIVSSFLITEHIEGKIINNYLQLTFENKKSISEALEKLQSYGVYHGDANHTNFIFTEKGIRIIDTQGKKAYTSFKQQYDFITLDDCVEEIYKIHKFNYWDPFYWMALITKKYKKNMFNKKFSELKERFRKK